MYMILFGLVRDAVLTRCTVLVSGEEPLDRETIEPHKGARTARAEFP